MSTGKNSPPDVSSQQPSLPELELIDIEGKLTKFLEQSNPVTSEIKNSDDLEKKKVAYKDVYQTLAEMFLMKDRRQTILRFRNVKSKFDTIVVSRQMATWVHECWLLQFSDKERKELENEAVSSLEGEQVLEHFPVWWNLRIAADDKKDMEKQRKAAKRRADASSVNEGETLSSKRQNVGDSQDNAGTGSENPSPATPAVASKPTVNHHRIWE